MEEKGRDHGLAYVLNTYEKHGKITEDDVKIFLNDLRLPHIPNDELKVMMKRAGATDKGFKKSNQFFAFVIENLKEKYDEEGKNLKNFLYFVFYHSQGRDGMAEGRR